MYKYSIPPCLLDELADPLWRVTELEAFGYGHVTAEGVAEMAGAMDSRGQWRTWARVNRTYLGESGTIILTMVTRERECRGCRTIYQYNTKVLCQMFSIVSWKKDTGCNYMVLCRAPTGPARTQRRCTAKASSWARPNQGFSGEHYYLKQEMDKFRKWFKYFASERKWHWIIYIVVS